MAAIIDPVLGFDQISGHVERRLRKGCWLPLGEADLSIAWVLETHAHADHLSAADHIRRKTGANLGAGRGILKVQKVFAAQLGVQDMKADGGDFDRLLVDGDRDCAREIWKLR